MKYFIEVGKIEITWYVGWFIGIAVGIDDNGAFNIVIPFCEITFCKIKS